MPEKTNSRDLHRLNDCREGEEMTPLENFAAGGFIVIGIFTFMFIITGAVEFHQRGVKRIEKAKERGIW